MVAEPSDAASVLSRQEAEEFIAQYYGFLIGDPKVRGELVQLARFVVEQNITDYGLQSYERLQGTLEEILDNHLSRGVWEPKSLNAPLTDAELTLEGVLAAPEERPEQELKAELDRGDELLEVIRHSLPENDFQSLVTMLGGADNFASILGSIELEPSDLSSAGKFKEVIRWLSGLPPETRVMYANYSNYQKKREKSNGHKGQIHITALDVVSGPIVKRILTEAYGRRPASLREELRLLGFRVLLERSRGLSGIVKAIRPELLHRIPRIHKWQDGQESVKTALNAIQEVLYKLPDYRRAEETGNREAQLRILNQILQQPERQRDYFKRAGLNGLMAKFIDTTGRAGLKRLGSASALLEFYDQRRMLDWFNPAYALHLAANRNGRVMVVDRSQEWPNWSYGSRSSYEGTGLEGIVNETLATYGLQDGVAEFCYMFFSEKDALLSNSWRARVILAYKLQVFLYMTGVIPRILRDGEVKRIGPQVQDLALLGYSKFTHNNGKNVEIEPVVVDKLFNLLMMNIVRRYTRDQEKKKETGSCDNDPSVEGIINEVGSHPLIVQLYGRPVSYDDVLQVEEVMRRYQTGQRSVTIQIGSQSMQMTPETLEDLWIMNPEFIKLRINGKLVNERLYYFWRRVENGENGTKKDSTDGSEPAWYALINHEGRQKGVVAYLGAAATWEAVASNPKAKFIKRGALPSRELVRLGVRTVAEGNSGANINGKEELPVVSYEDFSGWVPRAQLLSAAFKERTLRDLRKKPLSIDELFAVASEMGVKGAKSRTVTEKVRQWVNSMKEAEERINPRDPNLQNPTSYYGLKRFVGEKGKLIIGVLHDVLVQVITAAHPAYALSLAKTQAGMIITALGKNDVLTLGDLEERVSSGTLDRLEGLGSVNTRARARLNYITAAYQNLGPLTLVKAGEEPSKPKPTKRGQGITYEQFNEFVPPDEFKEGAFKIRAMEALRERGHLPITGLAEIAKQIGFETSPGRGYNSIVRRILNGLSGKEEVVELYDARAPDIQNQAPHFWLKRFVGEKAKPIQNILYGALEQAIREARPDATPKDVHQNAAQIIAVLQRKDILTQGDLEQLLQVGNVHGVNGLVSADKRKRARLNYFTRACELAGYDVTNLKAGTLAVAASVAALPTAITS